MLAMNNEFHDSFVSVAEIWLRAITVHFPATNSETPNIRILVSVIKLEIS